MELFVIIVLMVVNLMLFVTILIANAIIREKKEIIDAKDKVIATLLEQQDYTT